MNRDGMWKAGRDFTESMCRANLRQVEGFFDLERKEFKGYEFDISVKGRKDWRAMLGAEAFASAAAMKKFFVGQQISFQGGEPETTALLDIMAEKASKGGRTYVYPREGFFIEDNPEVANPEPVKIYLTQDTFLSSVKEGDDDYFRLRYRPSQAISAYNIDLHKAPILDETMAAPIHDLFAFNRADVVANLLGWMVAAHYRSVYMHAFHQFPMLQVYGAAGSGKTQTIMMLAHLHWYMTPVSVKSAMSCTNFAMDSHASSSTSAPFILDEYKPRVLKSMKGRLEKIKDVFKMSYTGGDIGERGTLNRGAENHLAIIKSKATAPIVFMGEAVEVESAIVERSVTVMLSESFHTRERQQAFLRLQQDPSVLSAIGRAIIEAGFRLNVSAMSEEVIAIRESIEAKLPAFDDESLRRMAPRLVYNRAVVIHGLSILQRVLHKVFGAEFDGEVDTLLARSREVGGDENDRIMQTHSMSELSKVLSRVALLSREIDAPYEMKAGAGKDYYVGDGWVEVKVERAYDNYRRYCASINDVPLFDNLEAFSYALDGYSPCIDKVCASSSLRASASSERVVRFDSRKLLRQGVQTFRS